MLQRRVPHNIVASQQNKLVGTPATLERRSPQAGLSMPMRCRFFSLAAAQGSFEAAHAWERGFLLVQNNSAFPLYMQFDRPADANSYQIPPFGEFKTDRVCPNNSVNLFSNGSDIVGTIIEG